MLLGFLKLAFTGAATSVAATKEARQKIGGGAQKFGGVFQGKSDNVLGDLFGGIGEMAQGSWAGISHGFRNVTRPKETFQEITTGATNAANNAIDNTIESAASSLGFNTSSNGENGSDQNNNNGGVNWIKWLGLGGGGLAAANILKNMVSGGNNNNKRKWLPGFAGMALTVAGIFLAINLISGRMMNNDQNVNTADLEDQTIEYSYDDDDGPEPT